MKENTKESIKENDRINEDTLDSQLSSASGGNDLSTEERRVGLPVRGRRSPTNAPLRDPRETPSGTIK